MARAQLIEVDHPQHNEVLAKIIARGGLVGAIWGHHLYFLAGNAYNSKAVRKMNKIKGRPVDQVLASPGAVEEAEEFADLSRCKGLNFAARQMNMSHAKYLEFLFTKFPLAVELYARKGVPDTVTFATENGRTIWIAGHLRDKLYSKFLGTVRELRKEGKKVLFAGTSLNLSGDNTLTVKQFDQVITHFADKLDAISVFKNASHLKKLRYSTSSSAVSFVHSRPVLIRRGCTNLKTLEKYIPGLEIPTKVPSTRK